MRKIETLMNEAVANNKCWQSANTSVHYNEENGVSIVRLHGNKIAEVGDDFLQIFDGGWQSNTTKSRLNAMICLLYTSPSPRDATLSRMPSSA